MSFKNIIKIETNVFPKTNNPTLLITAIICYLGAITLVFGASYGFIFFVIFSITGSFSLAVYIHTPRIDKIIQEKKFSKNHTLNIMSEIKRIFLGMMALLCCIIAIIVAIKVRYGIILSPFLFIVGLILSGIHFNDYKIEKIKKN
ncbi:MAG: hypothetical protein WC682_04095 [Parcubacteria group bacterium]|jgi:hypothetical protein